MRAMRGLVATLLFLFLNVVNSPFDALGRRVVAARTTVGTAITELEVRETAADQQETESILRLYKAKFQSIVSLNTSSGARTPDGDREVLQDVVANLHEVVDTTKVLLTNLQRCNPSSPPPDSVGNVGGTTPFQQPETCPAPAPELLQGSTAAFLSTFIHTYPHGPTGPEAMAAWAAAANTFLSEHRRQQRQQRSQWLGAVSGDSSADDNIISREQELSGDISGTAAPAPAPVKKSSKGLRHNKRRGGVGRRRAQGEDEPARQMQHAAALRRLLEEAFEVVIRKDDSSRGSSSSDSSRSSSPAGNEYSISSLDGTDGGGIDFFLEDGVVTGTQPDRGGGVNVADSTPVLDVKYGGLPLVRRLLLAQLLLGWIKGLHRDLSATPRLVMEEVLKLISLLYEIHVESVVQRGIMEYFHISKAGGTSWGTAARKNQCARSTVCDFDDECRWINGTVMREVGGIPVRTDPGHRQVCSRFDVMGRMSAFTDCEGRLHFARARRLKYVPNEYTLTGGLYDMYDTRICPQFVNVINIREPLSRLISNIKYMILRLRSVLFTGRDALAPFERLFCNASADTWEAFAPPVADNYNVRSLIGERGFHTTLYGIGEAHEAVAKQLLAQYDLILDLGAGEDATEVLMRMGLGWNKTLAEVHSWSTEQVAQASGLDLNRCGLGDLQPLLIRQVYDQRWYRFGAVLSRLDQVFLSAAAQLGLAPKPDDAWWPWPWPGLMQQQQKGEDYEEQEEEEEEEEESRRRRQLRHSRRVRKPKPLPPPPQPPRCGLLGVVSARKFKKPKKPRK